MTKTQTEPHKMVNLTENSYASLIPFNCCNMKKTKFQQFCLDSHNVKELDGASHKLDKYSRDLDELNNQPVAPKNIS